MCLGIPGRIVAIPDAQQAMATVEVAGIYRPVNIACILSPKQHPESCIGQWVLVHVGFAMSCIDPQEAAHTLEILRQLGELPPAERPS
ncbi:MAG: HypC/HybG/HupF family hydrogenase formation chaperone [Cellvibrionaceae bacterium]|nr:HypC/HybG/HupF family hydrogenase formation chaperone [Cellvibrionaceae bacterium]